MEMIKKLEMIKETDEQLGKTLTPYQNASAETIAAHLNKEGSNRRAILADEVGLGKTFVAKRVISLLANEYYTAHKDEKNVKPFKVAYICPNLNVAEQNFIKLSIFPNEGTLTPDMIKAVNNAYDKYEENITRSIQNKNRYINDNVFVRIRDWINNGLPFGSYKELYPNDWASGHNGLSISDKQNYYRETLLNLLNNIFFRGNFSYTGDNYFKKFYYFNDAVYHKLKGDIHEDYRLTMQHLYSYEARGTVDRIMQLESLTPRTSIDLKEGTGTAEERALLHATLSRAGVLANYSDEEKRSILEMYQGKAKKESFAAAALMYEKLLDGFDTSRIQTELQKHKVNIRSVSAVRSFFAEYNAENCADYDLVIMDEFQNFKELINCSGSNEQAYMIAQKIFDSKKCKVLMLSATPFTLDDTVFDETEQEGLISSTKDPQTETGSAYDDFFALMRFMGADDSWIETWKRSRKDGATCSKLLMEKGVFRTERAAAAKYTLIERVYKEVGIDLKTPIETNILLDGTGYQTRFGVDTPFPEVFCAAYQFGEKVAVNKYRLDAEMLLGVKPLPELPKRYQALEERLLGSNDDERKKLAAMLWIPPCGKTLGGAFAGMEGFSKKLIFTAFTMTPMAFTYLLCARVKYIIGQSQSKNDADINENDLEIPKNNYPMTSRELRNHCVKMFNENKAAVRALYTENDYKDYKSAVKKYCNDMRFADMISEYISMLAEEYSQKDFEMFRAVMRVDKLAPAKGSFKFGQTDPEQASLYAAGLFPEESGKIVSDRRIKILKDAFNSPFYPFVLTSTSIGSEGIDLHWYARHVIHWSVPSKASDIEQREGRVLRRNCHAVRLAKAFENPAESDCINTTWFGSEMYYKQICFKEDSVYRVTAETFFEKNSPENLLFERALNIIKNYRLMLGSADGQQGSELDISPYSVKVNKKE